jgi:hypothetical protein|tara:strand:- start:61 stop:906 length:846 start_codon:yes stop_codon:yes gene_type:complete
MNNVVFIADFFAEEVNGGGELNNEILIQLLIEKGYSVKKINSYLVNVDFLKSQNKSKFIIANFVNLNPPCKQYIQKHCHYVIYEHDHKYLLNRDPAEFKDYLAPPEQIINKLFYKNSKSVFCQSNFHSNIVSKNLKIDNIVSLGGNLWSIDALNTMREHCKKKKNDRCSIMDSRIKHKNTSGAIKYCMKKGYEYDLILPCSPNSFLNNISMNDKLVFFPLTPETLSRIVVEARMMGMKVITNKRLGAVSESWFSMKGEPLIDYMTEKRIEILNRVEEFINE